VRHCLSQLIKQPRLPNLDSDVAVVDQAVQNETQNLEAIIETCKPELLLEYLSHRAALSDKLDQVQHSLLKILPTNDFQDFSFAFCSKFVATKVFEKQTGHALDSFKAMLATNTDEIFAALRGQAYEAYVHRSVAKLLAACPNAKRLLDGRSQAKPFPCPDLPSKCRFDDPKEVKPGEYGIPRSRTFSAVDAIAKPNIAFQMTVNVDHGFKVDGLSALKTAVGLRDNQVLHVALVCPPDIAPNIKRQKLFRGKQIIKNPRALIDGVGLQQYSISLPWE